MSNSRVLNNKAMSRFCKVTSWRAVCGPRKGNRITSERRELFNGESNTGRCYSIVSRLWTNHWTRLDIINRNIDYMLSWSEIGYSKMNVLHGNGKKQWPGLCLILSQCVSTNLFCFSIFGVGTAYTLGLLLTVTPLNCWDSLAAIRLLLGSTYGVFIYCRVVMQIYYLIRTSNIRFCICFGNEMNFW